MYTSQFGFSHPHRFLRDDMKYTIPKPFYKIFEDLGNTVFEVTSEMMDRDLYKDLLVDIDKRFYWDEYKSNEDFDKDNIYESDITFISQLILQMILFHRIVRENDKGDKNNPRDEVPMFFRQFDDEGNEEDLYNLSSGKIYKKWSKSDKGRKKLEEVFYRKK